MQKKIHKGPCESFAIKGKGSSVPRMEGGEGKSEVESG